MQCSLDVNINGACCYVPDEYHYIFALSKIYMIYSEAVQNDVGKREKDNFMQGQLFCFQLLVGKMSLFLLDFSDLFLNSLMPQQAEIHFSLF